MNGEQFAAQTAHFNTHLDGNIVVLKTEASTLKSGIVMRLSKLCLSWL
jgi:hypothetical protein